MRAGSTFTEEITGKKRRELILEEIFDEGSSGMDLGDLNTANLESAPRLPHAGPSLVERTIDLQEVIGQTQNLIRSENAEGLTEDRIRDWEGRVGPQLPN